MDLSSASRFPCFGRAKFKTVERSILESLTSATAFNQALIRILALLRQHPRTVDSMHGIVKCRRR